MTTLAPTRPSSAQLAFDPPVSAESISDAGGNTHPGYVTEHSAPRLFEPAKSTLEDRVLDVWEDLAIRGLAECPVCGGSLLPEGCADCFSELS